MKSCDSSFWFKGLHNAKKTKTTSLETIIVVLECPIKKVDGMRKK